MWLDFLLIIIIAAALLMALRHLLRARRTGCSCGCASCSDCSRCEKHEW